MRADWRSPSPAPEGRGCPVWSPVMECAAPRALRRRPTRGRELQIFQRLEPCVLHKVASMFRPAMRPSRERRGESRAVTPGNPVRRALVAVALGVRHFAIQCEFVAWPQVANVVPDGQPHFASDDEGLDRERMRVRLKHGRRRPRPLDDFVEAQCLRFAAEGFKGRQIHFHALLRRTATLVYLHHPQYTGIPANPSLAIPKALAPRPGLYLRSAWMFASRTVLPQDAFESATKRANSVGVPTVGTTSSPVFANDARTVGSSIRAFSSRLSCATMAGSVFAGANTPTQIPRSGGMPARG